jgi:hypothetical protein
MATGFEEYTRAEAALPRPLFRSVLHQYLSAVEYFAYLYLCKWPDMAQFGTQLARKAWWQFLRDKYAEVYGAIKTLKQTKSILPHEAALEYLAQFNPPLDEVTFILMFAGLACNPLDQHFRRFLQQMDDWSLTAYLNLCADQAAAVRAVFTVCVRRQCWTAVDFILDWTASNWHHAPALNSNRIMALSNETHFKADNFAAFIAKVIARPRRYNAGHQLVPMNSQRASNILSSEAGTTFFHLLITSGNIELAARLTETALFELQYYSRIELAIVDWILDNAPTLDRTSATRSAAVTIVAKLIDKTDGAGARERLRFKCCNELEQRLLVIFKKQERPVAKQTFNYIGSKKAAKKKHVFNKFNR